MLITNEFLKKLKQLSGINKLEFVAPYKGKFAKQNNVPSFAAELFIDSDNADLTYFLDLFQSLSVDFEWDEESTNKPGIIFRTSNLPPFTDIDQIIIKDDETLALFHSIIDKLIEKETKLIISKPVPDVDFVFNENKTNAKEHEYAVVNILKMIILSYYYYDVRGISFKEMIDKLRSQYKNLTNMSFREIKNDPSLEFKDLIYFFNQLIRNPVKTQILDLPYVKDLAVSAETIFFITAAFLQSELLFTDKSFLISFQLHMLKKLQSHTAFDGNCYKENYTEIKLFSDALFSSQEDGSMLIDFKNTKSYQDNYAIGKPFEGKLDLELDHLFRELGIETEKVAGSYANGCIIPTKSVQALQKQGVELQPGFFDHEILAKKFIFIQLVRNFEHIKFFSYDKANISLPYGLFKRSFPQFEFTLSAKNLGLPDSKDFAYAFSFNPELIVNLTDNDDSLNIHTKSKQNAKYVCEKILEKLTDKNGRDYKFDISTELYEPLVVIKGSALRDVFKHLQDYGIVSQRKKCTIF